MATFLADADGIIRIDVPTTGGDVVTIGINADGDQRFTPGQVVELDDARLAVVCGQILGSIGLAAAAVEGPPDGP
jgi:hypothetical protein